MTRICRVIVLLGLSICCCNVGTGATWYVDCRRSGSGQGRSSENSLRTIQEGIEAAGGGDAVIVGPGTYVENIDFHGKNIVLTGTDPLDLNTVTTTVIDGAEEGCVVTFDGTEQETCVLTGFTIQNGKALDGGGIDGGRTNEHTHATIRQNVITGNSATNRGGAVFCFDGIIENNIIVRNSADLGGGAVFCDGTIRNNAISLNSATSGGGLAFCDGAIEGNTIARNSADHGAGLYTCDGTIRDNTIRNNSATEAGGGLFSCGAIIMDNLITENSARFGAGLYSCAATIRDNTISENTTELDGCLTFCSGAIYNNVIIANSTHSGGALFQCDGEVRSNLISGNSASYWGGGAYNCDGRLLNNTIVANTAATGGALARCDGEIVNCIIYENVTTGGGPQISNSSVPTYSCIQDWDGGGEGNLALAPQFVDPNGPDNNFSTYQDNDYRLLPDSPCVDVGANSVLTPPGVDLDRNLRIALRRQSLTVDMGAFEYNSSLFAVTHFSFVTIPWPGGRRLTWNSQPNDTYTVWFRYSFQPPQWYEVKTVPSQGAVTSCTDDAFLIWNWQTLFYRVEMK